MKIIISLFIFCLYCHANNLSTVPASEFLDQHENSQKITLETKWVLFAPDKDSFAYAKAAFENLNIKSAGDYSGILVSDISAMPTLITKMFALPKMKKYNFLVALDKTGQLTKDWPRQSKNLTLIKLKQLQVLDISYLKSEADTLESIKNLDTFKK